MSRAEVCHESLGLSSALWQSTESRAVIVLEEVFSWLDGKDLARAGATCRLWRQVGAMPALWRHLVLREEVDTQYGGPGHRRWRQQYVCAHAPWDRTERLRVGALALHGALSAVGDRLALAFADASVSVWKPEKNTWVELCHCDLRETRGWTSAARVQWARGGHRLLAAGPVALAEPGSAWELVVLRFDEHGTGRIASRARCGAGAAGCWVNAAGDAFLSLEPLLLAPGLAITSVWLNSATQETQSEYAGVASCLFRIFNEGGTHLSHVVVAEHCESHECVLLATWGRTLGAWSLDQSRPTRMEVHASDSLPDRVRLVRERAMLPDPEPVEADEAAVRALCATPRALCALPAAPLGLVLLDRPGEPRLWISMSDGTVMGFSTPDLVPLRTFSPSLIASTPTPLVLHYVQPAISELHLACPQGSLSGTVCVWAVRGAGSCGMRLLEHGSPAAVALFASGFPPRLLVLAGDELHVWKSRATPQLDINFAEDPFAPRPTGAGRGPRDRSGTSVDTADARRDLDTHAGMAPLVFLSQFGQEVRPLVIGIIRRAAGSCSGPRLDPPCECTAPPTPPCRTVASPPAHTVRVHCRPPTPAPPPPCPPCEPHPPLTCANASTEKEVHLQRKSPSAPIYSEENNLESGRDRVACRLGRAECARRLSYEQEATLERRSPSRRTPTPRYRLRDDTDGTECRIRRGSHSDPCAHRPRLLLDIQRTSSEPLPASSSHSRPQQRDENATSRGRCERTVAPATGHSRCRPLSIVERLRGLSRPAGGGRRDLHSAAGGVVSPETNVHHRDGLIKVLENRERLREAGRGRVVCGATESEGAGSQAAGTLDLAVPAGVHRVRVRVRLTLEDGGRTPPARIDPPSSGHCSHSWLSIKNIQNRLSGKKKEIYDPAKSKKSMCASPCTSRDAGADSAGAGAGSAGAGAGIAGAGAGAGSAGAGAGAGAGTARCGAAVLLSAAPMLSQ